MKTTENNSRYFRMTVSFFVFWIILISVLFCKTLNAQSVGQKNHVEPKNYNDPNFPSAGRFNAGVITTFTTATPPPAVIADVTYGISGRLSVGILAGTTGALAVAGIKINAALLERDRFRIISRTIIAYYPERNGKFMFDRHNQQVMAWMLSMSVIDAEIRSNNGVRYSVGLGFLETHCVEGMKKYFWGTSEESKVVPFELFQTLQASVALPMSKKLTFRPEVILIMKDWHLIRSNVFRVSPINPYLKFVYTF